MIEPVKTEDSFKAIAEDFNQSAKKFANSEGPTLDGLITKFNILWKFKAETPAHQEMLNHGLFNSGMQVLRTCLDTSRRDTVSTASANAQQIFNFLTSKDQIAFLPDNASTQFVDAALDLLKRSENISALYDSYSSRNNNDLGALKGDLVGLAKTLVTYAEKTQGPKQARGGVMPAKLPAPKVLSFEGERS